MTSFPSKKLNNEPVYAYEKNRSNVEWMHGCRPFARYNFREISFTQYKGPFIEEFTLDALHLRRYVLFYGQPP